MGITPIFCYIFGRSFYDELHAPIRFLVVNVLPNDAAQKVYDPRTVPGAKVQKGAACHVLPGIVELNVTISWAKSYYVMAGSAFLNLGARDCPWVIDFGDSSLDALWSGIVGGQIVSVKIQCINVAESKAHIISLDAK